MDISGRNAGTIQQVFTKRRITKNTTMVECLSQYNQGRQATLHPPTLRAMLNIAGIYLKQTEGALGFQKGIMIC